MMAYFLTNIRRYTGANAQAPPIEEHCRCVRISKNFPNNGDSGGEQRVDWKNGSQGANRMYASGQGPFPRPLWKD